MEGQSVQKAASANPDEKTPEPGPKGKEPQPKNQPN
jgi:hypothetical protein